MGFRADFDGWLNDSKVDVGLQQLAVSAIEDAPGVVDVLGRLDDGADGAFIRVLGVVEVLNEILRMRKSLPEGFAEVLQKMREALKKIAREFGAASYQLTISSTPPSISIGMNFTH
jgi:hypothetical protein